MPIPPFDGITNTLPPHVGDPTNPSHLSPYVCTCRELCDRFATSRERKAILEGLLRLRDELISRGINGFQWIDGSFLEDVETAEGRAPNDIDVVTFVADTLKPADIGRILTSSGDNLLDRKVVESIYKVDHFLVPLGSRADLIVEHTRYWTGLFSHRRDRIWKGMLNIDLNDKASNDAALAKLRATP